MNKKLQCAKAMYGYKKPYSTCVQYDKKLYQFDNDFILKLDSFLAGKTSCNLNKSDKNSIDSFVQYGSKDERPDGWEKQLDELLGRIVNMLDPEAIAVESLVSASSIEETKAKAVDLLEALGSLQKLETSTQGQIDAGVEEAIKKAAAIAVVMG